MNETVLVHVNSPVDLRATALRPEGDPAWHIFLAHGDDDAWLCVIDSRTTEALAFDVGAGLFYAKLAALLGATWDECWNDPRGTLRFQREALEAMGDRMRARIRNSTLEEIVEWRAEMQTAEPGELLRARITGDEPLAVRN